MGLHRGLPIAIGIVAMLGAVGTPANDDGGSGCKQSKDDRFGVPGTPIAHDPTIVMDGKNYVLFTTGKGVPMRVSKDLKVWGPEQRVFETPPAWAPRTIEGFKDHLWAPDVSRFGGKWHLYYSVSTFGKNRSAIGHATNVTLDPENPRYEWHDDGPVFQSYPKDDYNAIDPNVVLDDKGKPWLSFGSFWNGLRLLPLDGQGRVLEGAKPLNIAARPHEGPEQPGAIEAPFIVRRSGYFYLFASYDFCCRGAKSTYNVRVGRSRSVRGPYVDREGKSLVEGGGTKILEGGTRWKGPGHEAVLQDGKDDLLVYHAYDADDKGTPKLRISRIEWRDGWPWVPAPG